MPIVMPAAIHQVRHYRFALMYLYGPDGLRGNWEECGRQAGFKEPVSKRGKAILAVLDEVAQYRPPPARVDLSDLNIPSGNADQSEWQVAAAKVKPLLMQAALGHVEMEPQQRLIIKEIIDRAEGKAGTTKDDGPKLVQPVILLPTIGGEKAATLCPECAKRVTAKEGTP